LEFASSAREHAGRELQVGVGRSAEASRYERSIYERSIFESSIFESSIFEGSISEASM
jgi:hypothetical protein